MNIIDSVLDEAGLLEFYNLGASEKCFIAGGSCTNVFFNATSLGNSDIDFYVDEEHEEFIGDTLLYGGKYFVMKQNKYVKTYFTPMSQQRIQVIINPYIGHDNSESLMLNNFDLTACQLIYKFGGLHDLGIGSIDLLKKGLMRATHNLWDYSRVIKYMERYPIKLDFSHLTTVRQIEQLREKLYTKFNHTDGVQQRGSYED